MRKSLYTTLFIFLFAGISATMAQFPVVLTIDDSANKTITNVKIRGSYNGWMNQDANDSGTDGDATAGDNIWSVTVMAAAGTHEWGGESDGNWLIDGPNREFTVDTMGNVTGETNYTIPAAGNEIDVVLTITDSNQEIDGMQIRGSYNGWTDQMAFDDGTNGDTTAGDYVYTVVVTAETGKSYEWGGDRLDCPSPAWVIQGSNPSFSVGGDSSITGTTNYVIPSRGTTYNVTFRVDMSAEFQSDSIFVAGNFQVCPWSKTLLKMEPLPGTPDVYEATAEVGPGVYEYKFYNGTGGDPDGEANGGTPFANVFVEGGCGVDNGLGGNNRQIDLTSLSGDIVLPALVFNSCDTSTLVSVKEVQLDVNLNMFPNPFDQYTMITFDNNDGDLFQLTITDVTGKEMVRYNNIRDNQIRIDASDLGKGVFFATLRDESGAAITKKLLVQ